MSLLLQGIIIRLHELEMRLILVQDVILRKTALQLKLLGCHPQIGDDISRNPHLYWKKMRCHPDRTFDQKFWNVSGCHPPKIRTAAEIVGMSSSNSG